MSDHDAIRAEPLTENERTLALEAWAVDEQARRWGNLVLGAYDGLAAEWKLEAAEVNSHRHQWGPWRSSLDMFGGKPYRVCECGEIQFWDEAGEPQSEITTQQEES